MRNPLRLWHSQIHGSLFVKISPERNAIRLINGCILKMGVDVPHTFAQVAHCRQCVCFWMGKGHPIYSIQPKQTSDKLSACSQVVDTFKHCCGNIASSHKYNAQEWKSLKPETKEKASENADDIECQTRVNVSFSGSVQCVDVILKVGLWSLSSYVCSLHFSKQTRPDHTRN